MSNSMRGAYYRALKEAGVEFTKHFREYPTSELKEAYEKLVAEGIAPQLTEKKPRPQEQVMWEQAEVTSDQHANDALARQFEEMGMSGGPTGRPADPVRPQPRINPAPVQQSRRTPQVRNPIDISKPELAGQRMNTHAPDEPLYVDDNGVAWFQREVRKPAFPKPRGRRVLQYVEHGTRTETVKNGDYLESFEISDERQPGRTSEVKITLPSYQTGIYKDPRLPFKVHVYNEQRGFDLFDVWDYFGGETLTPSECKRIYISNDLCYDIRSVINTIEAEYRQLKLQRRI